MGWHFACVWFYGFCLRAAGLRPGGPGPPTAWVLPSRAEGGKSSRVQPCCRYYISIHLNVAYYTACRTVSGEVRRSCPTAYLIYNHLAGTMPRYPL